MCAAPIPKNEMERLIDLAEFDLDYDNLETHFRDLTQLAAKVAGTKISMVNLIDVFTQYSVSVHGIEFDSIPREDSVCQYTIMQGEPMEIKDLTLDERFKDRDFGDSIKYYLGIPIKSQNGNNLGALCVIDAQSKYIEPEKIELLKIISNEIVNRLNTLKVIKDLKNEVAESKQTQKKVAHDIRGPIGGIIGLAQIIKEQGSENKLEEVLEFISLIQKSGTSLLELADEILGSDLNVQKLGADDLNLKLLRDKLEKLYSAQAKTKEINFKVHINAASENIVFSKNKLLQIIGNLISNAMKFTPENGEIIAELDILNHNDRQKLHISVSDSGVGLSEESIASILNGTAVSTNGTSGENGYGFGLALVKHLIDTLKGELSISSLPGKGAKFQISIPLKTR